MLCLVKLGKPWQHIMQARPAEPTVYLISDVLSELRPSNHIEP